MRYRRVGESGLVVSAVGLGGATFGGGAPGNAAIWGTLDLEETRRVVETAREAGITLIDLADAHAGGLAEHVVGEAIQGFRQEVVIATKWGSNMRTREDIAWGSRRYVRQAVEGSLGRLQTDYIDLYQYHWPDPRTPIEETLTALDELVREGKVRYIGCSHQAGWELADAHWTARSKGLCRFISAQDHYNLLERGVEKELVPACRRFGVGMLPFFALGKGLLTGRYRRDRPPPAEMHLGGRVIKGALDDALWDALERLERFAAERAHTLPELAIAFLLAQPVVASVLAGASTPDHVRQNVAAVDWELTPDEEGALRALLAEAGF